MGRVCAQSGLDPKIRVDKNVTRNRLGIFGWICQFGSRRFQVVSGQSQVLSSRLIFG